MLSKALNTDPTSVVLWIVYLLIYSGNMKPDEEDDMFLCAVCFSLFPSFIWSLFWIIFLSFNTERENLLISLFIFFLVATSDTRSCRH